MWYMTCSLNVNTAAHNDLYTGAIAVFWRCDAQYCLSKVSNGNRSCARGTKTWLLNAISCIPQQHGLEKGNSQGVMTHLSNSC